MRRLMFAVLFAAGGVNTARADIVLSTGVPFTPGQPSAVGNRVFFGLEVEMNATRRFGQTFTVPDGLSSISGLAFGAALQTGSARNFSYTAILQAWDPITRQAVGPVLFTQQRSVLDPQTLAFQLPQFATPGVTLTPGQMYVAELIAGSNIAPDPCFVNPLTDDCPGAVMEIIGGRTDTYSGGGVVLPPGTSVFDVVPVQDPFHPFDVDVAFSATFTTPEPASFVLVASGCCFSVELLGVGDASSDTPWPSPHLSHR